MRHMAMDASERGTAVGRPVSARDRLVRGIAIAALAALTLSAVLGCSPDEPSEPVPRASQTPEPAEEPTPTQEAQAGDELTVTPWTMTRITSEGGGGLVPAVEGTEVTIAFVNGKVAGNTGVNSYSGTYSLEGDRLTITPQLETQAEGSIDLMDQQSAYLAALSRVETYRVENGTLTLLAVDGTTLAEFAAAR